MSVVCVHISNDKKTKPDDKSEKFIFVGYGQSSKGYKLYIPNNNMILNRRDVIFDEEGEWYFGT